MSAVIDRLRQIAAAWHRAVHVDSSMIPVHICDLDAVLADVSAERTRASAAEADRDALRAECERLRAIVEGSTTAPTDAEMREHMDSGGAWLVTIPARRQVRLHPETRYVDQPRAASLLWWTEGARWVAVRDGRPCAWPVTPPTARVALPVAAPVYEPPGCHSDDDGDCVWAECPQLRDNEPRATGRHCPRDLRGDE